MHRRSILALALGFTLLALVGCAPAASPATPAKPAAPAVAPTTAGSANNSTASSASAASPPAAPAREPDKVAVALVRSINSAPFAVAQGRGYYEAEGLAVEPAEVRSAADTVAALGTGQLDVNVGTISAGTFNSWQRGVKMIVPANPATAITGVVAGNPASAAEFPNMLQLMFFALMLGIAATLVSPATVAPLLRALESLYALSAKIVDILMTFAPYAVACLLFNNIARFGIDLLGALSWFVVTVLLGLGLQMFGVYSLSIALLSRISPLEFFRRVKFSFWIGYDF